MLNYEIRRVGTSAKFYLAGTIISLGVALSGFGYGAVKYMSIDNITENRPQILTEYFETKRDFNVAKEAYDETLSLFGFSREEFKNIYNNSDFRVPLDRREYIARFMKKEEDLEAKLSGIKGVDDFNDTYETYFTSKSDARKYAGLGFLAALLPTALVGYFGWQYDRKKKTLDELKRLRERKREEARQAEREAEDGKVA